MCKVVREDKRLAHALHGEQPIFGVVLSVCQKDFGCDAGTDGRDKVKNVVLAGRVRRKRKSEKGKLPGLRSGAASSWKGLS